MMHVQIHWPPGPLAELAHGLVPKLDTEMGKHAQIMAIIKISDSTGVIVQEKRLTNSSRVETGFQSSETEFGK